MEIHSDTAPGKYIIHIMYTVVLETAECTFFWEGGGGFGILAKNACFVMSVCLSVCQLLLMYQLASQRKDFHEILY
jgi:hypothetical protein